VNKTSILEFQNHLFHISFLKVSQIWSILISPKLLNRLNGCNFEIDRETKQQGFENLKLVESKKLSETTDNFQLTFEKLDKSPLPPDVFDIGDYCMLSNEGKQHWAFGSGYIVDIHPEKVAISSEK